jgi:hypothetical protein
MKNIKLIPPKNRLLISTDNEIKSLVPTKLVDRRSGIIVECGSEVSEEVRNTKGSKCYFGPRFAPIPIKTEEVDFIVMEEENLYIIEKEE